MITLWVRTPPPVPIKKRVIMENLKKAVTNPNSILDYVVFTVWVVACLVGTIMMSLSVLYALVIGAVAYSFYKVLGR